MKKIIEALDASIVACLNSATAKGLCRLVDSDNRNFPATTENDTPVYPNSKVGVTFYHRLLTADVDLTNEYSFGVKRRKLISQRVRTVVFFKRGVYSGIVIDNFINALPNKLSVTGYDLVTIEKSISLNRDAKSVWDAEYEKAYRDKYQTQFRVYALEYDVNYIRCASCVDSERIFDETFEETFE